MRANRFDGKGDRVRMERMGRFRWHWLWIVAVLAMLGFGCGADREDGMESGLVFARGADAQKLDPADIDDGESVNTLAPVLEGLVRFRLGTTELEPALAVSWEISEDGLRYRFQIRPGVFFHDGTPLNAETAAWSFRRQMDPEHPAHFRDASFPYWRNLFQAVTAIETPEEMTLEFQLSEPNAFFLQSLAVFPAWLVSPGALERFGSDMVRHPVGTGPFRFLEWIPNQAVVFERNPDYWDEPPAVSRLILRTIPDNTVRLLELRAGRVHGVEGLRGGELQSLREDPNLVVHQGPAMNLGYLAFAAGAESLREPRIRRAIAMAIDREALVRHALDGYGRVAHWPAPNGFPGIPESAPHTHDPDQAREILEQFPELRGRTLRLATFSAYRSYFPDPPAVASMIRSDLERVGLRVEVVTREFNSHLHRVRQGDFEMALLGWIADTPDTDNFLASLLAGWAATPGEATNIAFYRNDAFDRHLQRARQAQSAEEAAREYREALRLWERDLPLLPLVSGNQTVVLRREVEGFQLHPTGELYFHPVRWVGNR